MSPVRRFWRYKIELAFLSAIIILAGAALASYRAIELARSSVGWVDHTYQVLTDLDELIAAVTMVELGSRGFALTGEESMLRLYETAVVAVNWKQQRIKFLTRDNPEQQRSLPTLEALVNRNLDIASKIIAARRSESVEGASAALNASPRVVDDFHELADALKERELRLLKVRGQEAARKFTLTEAALLLATLAGLIITASAGIGTIIDVRKRRRAEAELFLEKERAQVTLASIADAVVRSDFAGQVTFLNRAGETLTGWTADEAFGAPFSSVANVCDLSTGKSLIPQLQTAMKEGSKEHLPDGLLLRRDGVGIPIEATIAPIHDSENNCLGSVMVFRDVTAAREAAQQLHHSAHHDLLTGLPNRMLLHDRIGQALASGRRHGNSVAVLFIDLDGFKLINDTRGHGVGDRLLQSVSKRLRRCVRDADTVSRIGGDEFVVLMSDVAEPADAATSAERILDGLTFPHQIDGVPLHVSASIGISTCPGDATNADFLIANADTAMYAAKSSGHNRYLFYPQAGETAPHGELARPSSRS